MLALNYEYPPVGGGAGRALEYLCRNLTALGVRVDAIVSKGLERTTDETGGATIFSVPTHRRGVHQAGQLAMVEYLLHALPLARRLIEERDYDIIHYFFSVPTGLLSFAIGGNRPYVVSLRGGDVPGYNPGEFAFGHGLLRPFNRTILRQAGAVVALSDDLRRYTEAFEPSVRVEVIRNGVDTDRFSPTDHPTGTRPLRKLIYVGRLVEWKGLEYALEALRLLPDEFSLVVVGSGSCEAELRRVSMEWGLENRLSFLGSTPHEDLPTQYRSADLFVIPSVGESFSQVTAEAMACGLPVVAARAGALPELIRDGVNGILVPPRDSAAIAQAILDLSRDPERRRAMALQNRADACERLSWRRAAEEYIAIYERCLRASKPSAAATSAAGTASTM